MLDEFFKCNRDGFYERNDGTFGLRSVKYNYDTVRKDKAFEQSNLPPVSVKQVISYVNEFLELLKPENKRNTMQIKQIELDNSKHIVSDNVIIATNCKWKQPVYKNKHYISWDSKYDVIKEKFKLDSPRDIVWIRFTSVGHVGTIGKSFDINFDCDTQSGMLVNHVGECWDNSFILIVPLNSDILVGYDVGEIELAIGEWLIKEKKVPVIDFYSHNN